MMNNLSKDFANQLNSARTKIYQNKYSPKNMKKICLIIVLLTLNACKKSDNVIVEVIPTQPTELKGTIVAKDQVDLTWKDNSTNETGYKIDRKTDSGNFTEIGNTVADVTTFSDKTVSINTNYTYRVYGFNQVGKSIAYSNEVSIKTMNVPTITTTEIANISTNGAITGGNVSSDGGTPITARGIVWGTFNNPTVALNSKTVDGTGIGSFQSSITGLTSNTTYYVRAYATNSIGTAYGNEITFKTSTVVDIPTGLIGYYPFSGNGDDASGNGNHGIVNGATLANDRFGNSNSAYRFNGTSTYIKINNSASLNNSSVSISGWFNASSLTQNDVEGAKGIIGKWWQSPSSCGGNYNAYLLCLTKPIGKSSTVLGGATNYYEGNIFYANSPLQTDNWYHFTFIHDANQGGRIYLNGILVNSNTIKGNICNSINAITIGADVKNGTYWRFFEGLIDDIRIYNRVLTPAEINYLSKN